MPFEARPLHPVFAAELTGFDMRRDTDPAAIASFIEAMNEFAVCVVRHDRALSDDEHIGFSRLLDPIEGARAMRIKGTGQRVPRSRSSTRAIWTRTAISMTTKTVGSPSSGPTGCGTPT